MTAERTPDLHIVSGREVEAEANVRDLSRIVQDMNGAGTNNNVFDLTRAREGRLLPAVSEVTTDGQLVRVDHQTAFRPQDLSLTRAEPLSYWRPDRPTTTRPQDNWYEELPDGTRIWRYPDGTYIRQGADGSFLRQNPDGSSIRRDAAGNTTWRYADGREMYQGADGSFFSRGADGSTYQRKSDGSQHWKYSDGREILQNADGSMFARNRDGSTYERRADGTQIWKYADGTIIQKNADGSGFMRKPDGSSVEQKPDGTIIWRFPDGRVVTQRPDGSREQRNADGSVFIQLPDGRIIRQYPDGRRTVQHQDGSREREYQDRSRVNADPRGQVTYIDNGSGANRDIQYDQNGRIVRVRGVDGSTWMMTGQNHWQNDRGDQWRGIVRGVDQEGNVYYHPANGQSFVHTRDGRVVPEAQMMASSDNSRPIR